MAKRLYVGNIPYNTDAEALTALFGQDGRKVSKVHIVVDRDTGRPRGFAFVDMESDADALAAIGAMDGVDFGGRALRVNEAEERRPPQRSGPPRDRGGFSAAPPRGGNDERRRRSDRSSERSPAGRGGERRVDREDRERRGRGWRPAIDDDDFDL